MNLRKFISLYLYLLFLMFDSLSRLCISIIRLALLAVFIKLFSMTLLYKKNYNCKGVNITVSGQEMPPFPLIPPFRFFNQNEQLDVIKKTFLRYEVIFHIFSRMRSLNSKYKMTSRKNNTCESAISHGEGYWRRAFPTFRDQTLTPMQLL